VGRTRSLLFIGSLLLFLAVLPGNHSEAEDAFEYSRLIEAGQGARLFHPHHLLYLPAQKAVFHAAQMLGYGGRSYYVARAVSMFSGAAALVLFFLIALRLGGTSDGRLPLMATLGLLFSYGFVRYACEVEIYLPAMVLALAAIHSALRAETSRTWFVAGIVFSSLAVLMHTINSALAVVVVPFFYRSACRGDACGCGPGLWDRSKYLGPVPTAGRYRRRGLAATGNGRQGDGRVWPVRALGQLYLCL